MSDGKTGWWSKDGAWWTRERVVELMQAFGPAGPAVLDWLSCQAQQQHAGGVVKAGYGAIVRGVGLDVGLEWGVARERARAIVERAVVLGAFDDITEDGIVFTCRVSGWQSDQEKASAAARQARYRAKPKPEPAPADDAERSDIDDLCQLLAAEMRKSDEQAKVAPESKRWRTDMRLLVDRDERTAEQVRHTIKWATADSFWSGVILSPASLRAKFPTLMAQMRRANTPPARQRPVNVGPTGPTPEDDPRRLELERRLSAAKEEGE